MKFMPSLNSLIVFRVKCGDRERTLHRNLLFLVKPVENADDGSHVIETADDDSHVVETVDDGNVEETVTGNIDMTDECSFVDVIDRLVPQPRRSNRTKRISQRYDNFVMNQIIPGRLNTVARPNEYTNPGPFDHKINAMNTLIESGVIGYLDSEIAHRILAAIFKL
ncbi:hypothetical protein ACF0H5_006522 [Mactra antiquata]